MVMNIRRISLALAGLLSAGLYAGAQIRLGEGQVSASLESNSVYYVDDKAIGQGPDDKFGTNNYLKVDYSLGRFSAGIQLEGYMPALYGYELGEQPDVRKFFLAGKYVQWTDDSFEVRAGDIYDQFGNGLIFRSYEDRQLGLNNSLEGIRGIYRLSNYLTVKGLYGRPRLYTNYAESWIRGADLSVSIADIFGWNAVFLNVEGSYINRYEALDKDETIDFKTFYGLDTPSLNMASGRVNFNWNTLSLTGEYAWKSKDVMIGNSASATEGSAIYAEALYSWKTLSVSATYRMLDNMGTNLTLYGSGTANMMNYLPSLTRQYTYLLANLNPYQVNTLGENAGQVDLFYSLRSSSSRQKYWNFHVNWSGAYTLRPEQTPTGKPGLMWSDVNFDIERQWSKAFKTIFLFSRQEMSSVYGYDRKPYTSDIFVADLTWKFHRNLSLRAELQYLLCENAESEWSSGHCEGDWVAALVEFSVAPRWSVYVSDMYNIGMTKIHYYDGGVSYSKGRTRVQLSYGRHRAGYVCSGGVCRYSPAYTGVNLLLTTAF